MGANPRACLRNLRGIPLSVLVAVTNPFDGLYSFIRLQVELIASGL